MKPKKYRRSRNVGLRFTIDEFKQIKMVAKETKVPISNLIRKALICAGFIFPKDNQSIEV